MKRTWIRGLSVLLAVAAGAYFVRYARTAVVGKDLFGMLDRQVILAGLGLTFLYMLLIPMTALAWTWLLDSMDQPARYQRMLPILAITQFGKYLPGNVAQHIGRVAMARTEKIPLSASLSSVAYEMLLMLTACAHIGALTLLWSPPAALGRWRVTHYRAPLLAIVTMVAIIVLLLAPRIATVLAERRARAGGGRSVAAPRLHVGAITALGCYAIYAANFCLVGIGLWLLAMALPGAGWHAPGPLFLTGAFACSWILGFLTPGAPAGLGVREAILGAWLSSALPPAQIVLLVITLRIATTLGDLLNFILGGIAFRFMHHDPHAQRCLPIE